MKILEYMIAKVFIKERLEFFSLPPLSLSLSLFTYLFILRKTPTLARVASNLPLSYLGLPKVGIRVVC